MEIKYIGQVQISGCDREKDLGLDLSNDILKALKERGYFINGDPVKGLYQVYVGEEVESK